MKLQRILVGSIIGGVCYCFKARRRSYSMHNLHFDIVCFDVSKLFYDESEKSTGRKKGVEIAEFKHWVPFRWKVILCLRPRQEWIVSRGCYITILSFNASLFSPSFWVPVGYIDPICPPERNRGGLLVTDWCFPPSIFCLVSNWIRGLLGHRNSLSQIGGTAASFILSGGYMKLTSRYSRPSPLPIGQNHEVNASSLTWYVLVHDIYWYRRYPSTHTYVPQRD